MRWYTLDKVVREALADRELPLHFYVPFLHLALKGIREIHFMSRSAQMGIKTERLPIDQDDFSAKLPADYVDYILIGKEDKNKIQAFATKDSLSKLTGQFTTSYPVEAEDDMVDRFTFLHYFADNSYLGQVYGFGGGIAVNSFRVIPEMDKIQFDPGVGLNEIYMEYIAEASEADTVTNVHPYAVQPLIDYILWKYKDRSKRYNRLEVAEAKNQFYASVRLLRGKMDKLTPVDIGRQRKRAFRRTYKP